MGARPLWEDLGEAGEEFQVIDEYAVRRRLAQGGMGEVFLARQLSTGREVALKWLFPGVPRERVGREIAALAVLDHPGIVKVLHCGEHAGRAYFAMDLVDGPDLARRMAERPFTVEEAAVCMEQVARAVAHAHRRGVLHRDVKPQNIVLGSDGAPRVTDFGLARRLQDLTLTRPEDRPGTPAYMAPEQADARQGPTTVGTDVYGLGATLYHLLTGEAPFRAVRPEAIYQLVLHARPTPPRVLNPRVPRELELICLKCLEKEPRRRFASAGELADELDRFLARRRPTAWEWAIRMVAKPGVRVALAAVLVVGAAWLVLRAGPERPQPLISRAAPAVPSPTNRIEFVRRQVYATELDGGVRFGIRRTGDTNSRVTVQLRTRGGSAIPERDFMRPDQRIEFAPGVIETDAGVPIWDNGTPQVDRSAVFELVEPSPGWTAPDSLTVTILDNDAPGGAGNGVGGAVRSLATDGAGRVVVAGGFNNASGAPAFSVARLTGNGGLDAGFQSGVGPDGWLNVVAAARSGDLYLGGDFARFGGVALGRCVRLRTDGAFDPGFRPVPGADGQITALAVQADGKLVISGDFLNVNRESRVRLARLLPDGALDTGFQPGSGLGTRASAVAVQEDGRILVAGLFQRFGEIPCNGLVRLNDDGSLDPDFRLGGDQDLGVESVVVQPDGRILIGGWFKRYHGQARWLVARLHRDGTLDETFRPDWDARGSYATAWNPNPHVRHVYRLADGRVLASGGFTEVNGSARLGLVRFLPDGRLDPTFQHGPGADGLVGATAVLADGRIVAAGDFRFFDGIYSPGLVILDPNGRVPARPPRWVAWERASGGNGHAYALTSRPGTREEVEREARAAGARLVAIADAREQAFLESTFLRGVQLLRPLWIGLREAAPSGTGGGSADGALRFAHGMTGEPAGVTERHWVAFHHAFADGKAPDPAARGRWSAVTVAGQGPAWVPSGPYFGIMEREPR